MRLERFSPAWLAKYAVRDPQTGCILWTGFACKQGYVRTWYNGQDGVLLHRIAYESAFGPFDQSLKVCHRCDVRRCFNPEHLFLGTQKDNLQDMFTKGRARPRGKTPRSTKVAFTAPLSSTVSEVELEKTVKDIGIVHLRRTSAMTPRWCQVVGAPGASDSAEIPPDRRPKWWTVVLPEKSSTVTSCGDSGALVAGGAK